MEGMLEPEEELKKKVSKLENKLEEREKKNQEEIYELEK